MFFTLEFFGLKVMLVCLVDFSVCFEGRFVEIAHESVLLIFFVEFYWVIGLWLLWLHLRSFLNFVNERIIDINDGRWVIN